MIFSERFIAATHDYCTYQNHINAPLLRKEFELPSCAVAELTICGLGFYEAWLNGKRITKGKLAPYIANPDEVLCYDCYDITDCVSAGKNILEILLGNGMLNAIGGSPWSFDKAKFRSAPKVALALEADGKIVFEADESFLCAPSPVVFDDLRAGEIYDARLESALSHHDTWRYAVAALKPSGTPHLVRCESIRAVREIKPASITRRENGYIYDFGVNTAGVCKLRLADTECGQKIVLLHGEMLVDGELSVDNILCDEQCLKEYYHKDVYICKGAPLECYEPHFTYHGFRYVFVTGLKDSQAQADSITLCEMHSDLSTAGKFTSSSDALNTLQANVCRSDLSNFYYFPTDCPQREKNGWTGDAALSAEQMLLNFHAQNSLREWLYHIRKAQRPDGQLPGIIPTAGWGFDWGNGPAWDAALVYLPYYIYRYGGTREALEENADAVALYLGYLSGKRNSDGLVAFGLGDWCQPKRLSHLYETPLEVTDSLISYNICRKAGEIFSLLGRGGDAQAAARTAKSFREAYRKKYVFGGKLADNATQTQIALTLAYGVLDGGEQDGAVAQLLRKIETDGGCFATGVLGARELFRVLSEHGHADSAYTLAMQDKFPSYYYHIKNGFTALSEDFHEFKEGTYIRKDGRMTNSLNHHFWGDISAWMYLYVAGINVNPNFCEQDKVVFAPNILQDLSYAEGEYRHRRGVVRLRWEKTAGGATVDIAVPALVSAQFVTPRGYAVEKEVHLTEGNNRLKLIKL